MHEKVGKIREGVKTLRELSKAKDSAQYNQRHGAREPTWQIGQQVLLKDARIKPNSDAVITHKPYAKPVYYIADIVKGDDIGEAYRLINAENGISLKRLVPSDRLRPWNNERELLQSRLPPLYHRSPATQGLSGPVRSEQTSSELVSPSDKPGKINNWYPAVKVEQQRMKGNKQEYKVLFKDGARDWCSEISPLLLRNWRLLQEQQRKKRRRRKE